MSTRLLMTLSSAFLVASGLGLSLAPAEALRSAAVPESALLATQLQVTGASLVGWAMVNWMARGFALGGIYSRPLTMGNLLHFGMGGLALLKAGMALGWPLILIVPTVAYLGFAAAFAYLVFGFGAACVR